MDSVKIQTIRGAGLTLPDFVRRRGNPTISKNKILDRKYFVFAVLGKRRSGKSTLTFNLLKKFATKNTIVIFFVHTFTKDDNYKEMREFLDSKGITWYHNDDVKEGVKEFIEEQKQAENPQSEEKKEPSHIGGSIDQNKINQAVMNAIINPNPEPEKKKGGRKKIPPPPEFIIIFDDVSDTLRETEIKKLIKNSFHYRAKVIIASQGYVDMSPDLYANLDYLALYKNFNDYALEHIYNKIDPTIDFEQFKELYHAITDDSYNFMFIDRNNDEFRINLDKKLKFSHK